MRFATSTSSGARLPVVRFTSGLEEVIRCVPHAAVVRLQVFVAVYYHVVEHCAVIATMWMAFSWKMRKRVMWIETNPKR